MLYAGARTRASIAVSLFDHANPYKRTQTSLSTSSVPSAYSPSSSSLLGPLNLHMYLDQALLPGVLATSHPFDVGTCIEEDELEQETSSQPSMSMYEPAAPAQCPGSMLNLFNTLDSHCSVGLGQPGPPPGSPELPYVSTSLSGIRPLGLAVNSLQSSAQHMLGMKG